MDKLICEDILKQIRFGYRERWNNHLVESHRCFSTALKLAQAGNNQCSIAYAMLAMADSSLWYLPEDLGDPWEYRHFYCKEALKIFKQIKEYRGVCKALCMLAATESDEENALRLCQESIDLGNNEDDQWIVAHSTHCKGNVYAMRGQKELAIPCLLRSLEMARCLDDNSLLVNALTSCAINCDHLSAHPQTLWTELFSLLEHEARWTDLARGYIMYATLRCDDNYDEAIKYIKLAVNIAKTIDAPNLIDEALLAENNLREKGDPHNRL